MEIVIKKDEKEILNDFLIEAFENLNGIETKILEMEEYFDLEHINEVFRPFHTLKGLSGFIEGMADFTKICQDAESILDALRKDELERNSDVIDVLLATVDDLKKILNLLDEKKDSAEDIQIILEEDIVEKLSIEELVQKNIDVAKEDKKDKESNFDLFYSFMKRVLIVFQKLIERIEQHRLTGHIYERIARLLKVFKHNIEKYGYKTCLNCYKELHESLITYDEKNIIGVFSGFIRKCSENIEKSAGIGSIICGYNQEHIYQEPYKREKEKESEANYLKVKSEKIDNIMGLVGELSTLKNSFDALYKELNDRYDLPEIVYKVRNLSSFMQKTIDELQNTIMEIRMVPVEVIFSKYHRIVRDLTRKLNKEVELIIDAKDSIIDKNLGEKINEPLLHIIRNAIDHGIEFPDERRTKRKKPKGIIKISAENKGRYILIEVYDDGRGLNKDAIVKKALEKGIIDIEKLSNMSDRDIYNLIFLPGFSTAKDVTEISGRGVGMEIVKKVVEEVKGSIEIFTEEDKFTKFVFKLPLMLSLNHGILVYANNSKFLIPIDYIEEIIKIDANNIIYYGETALGELKGKVFLCFPISFVINKLSQGIEHEILLNRDGNGDLIALLISYEGRYYSLVVKEVLGEQEFVLKSLPGNFKNNNLLLGAAIDVDGNIIPVINPVEVIKSYHKNTSLYTKNSTKRQ